MQGENDVSTTNPSYYQESIGVFQSVSDRWNCAKQCTFIVNIFYNQCYIKISGNRALWTRWMTLGVLKLL